MQFSPKYNHQNSYTFGMLSKTTNFQFGSFRSPEKHDSGLMPGRTYSSEAYSYGFNGMQKDDEISGEGNNLDFGARIYDSRLGRWMSVDELARKFPSHSTYCYAINSVLFYKDINGKDIIPTIGADKNLEIKSVVANFISYSQNTLTTKYLTKYMGPTGNQDLKIHWAIVSGNDRVASIDIPAATTSIPDNPTPLITFNRVGMKIKMPYSGYPKEMDEYKVRNEIGIASDFIHEVIFHANNQNASDYNDHNITSEMFDDAVNALFEYTSKNPNLKLSKAQAAGIIISGLPKEQHQQFIDHYNDQNSENKLTKALVEKFDSLTWDKKVLPTKETEDERNYFNAEDGKDGTPMATNDKE